MKVIKIPLFLLACFLGAGWLPLFASVEWPLSQGVLEIRVPEAPSPSESYAAEELQTYLRKMSGVEVPILKGAAADGKKAILLGRHESSKALWEGLTDPDHYIIEASADLIRIVGGYKPPVKNSEGTEFVFDWGILYGVYQLLEDQGIRWFRPEPEGEYVPKSQKLQVAEGRKDYQPAFGLRWGVALYASSFLKTATEEESLMARIWALRNKGNVTGLSDPKYGGQLNIGGGGHVYSRLVPASLFGAHPDFFPLIDGVRTPKGQLCLGNPALQDFVAEKIATLGKANPQLFMTSLDPNDGAGWCECEKCRAMDDPNVKSGRGGGLSMSSRVSAFNNIVAKKVSETCPGLLLYCLAYAQYMEAPTKVDHLEPNLVIGLAPFAGAFSDYSRALRDPESVPNRRFLESAEGYHKLGVKMYAREYLSHYMWPGPLPLFWTMQDRFQEYEKLGFIGVYSETHPCWGPQGANLYLYLRLLWNPHLDLKVELERYCRDFYGPAAAPMLRYHEALEKRGKNGPYFGSGGSSAQNLFTDAFLQELAPEVEQARQAARGQAPYEWRVDCVLAGYELARLYRQTANLIKAGKIKDAKASLAELDVLFGDRYPKGDVFNKGEGRAVNADGQPRVPSFIKNLSTEIAKADKIDSQYKNARLVQSFDSAWRFQTDPQEQGVTQGWHKVGASDAEWPRLNSGQPWQQQGFADYQGTAWYRRSFPTPAVDGSQRLVVAFAAVDGDTTVWVNGQEVGKHELLDLDGVNRWDDPFSFDITKFLNKEGLNTLSVRVKKTYGNGGIHRNVKLIRVDAP